MDCKELLEIFNKIGGEFVCYYKDNKGILLPQKIKCTNLNNASYELDSLVFGLSMYPSLFRETKLSQTEKVKKIHHYQDMSLKKLSIIFNIDDE